MKVLFDQGTPVPQRAALTGHEVTTATEAGWSTVTNGELLSQAEAGGFEALITTDQNLRYQQNLAGRRIRIVVLMSASWPSIQHKAAEVLAPLEALAEGGVAEVAV